METVNGVIDNILELENEQAKVAAYVQELEWRRFQLHSFIGSLTEAILTNKAKEKFSNKVLQMEMVLSFGKTRGIQPIEDKRRKICRHFNKGFCKMKDECVYFHKERICDASLQTGVCTEPKGVCWLRHPKECKHWLGDTRGCLRGEECKYLHKTENEGTNLKVHETEHEGNAVGNSSTSPKSIPTKKGKDQDTEKSNDGEKDSKEISDDNNVDMEEESPPKDTTNHEMKVVELKMENKTLIDQVEKLKQIVYNMNNELKARTG